MCRDRHHDYAQVATGRRGLRRTPEIGRKVVQGRRRRSSNRPSGERGLCPVSGGLGRGQRCDRRRPAKVNAMRWARLVFEAPARRSQELEALMDKQLTTPLSRSRSDALSAADRCERSAMLARSAAPSIDALFADVPMRRAIRGFSTCRWRWRARGRAPGSARGGRKPRAGAVPFCSRRRLAPPHPGGGRPSDPARASS